MKISTIISSFLLVIWVFLTILVIWTDTLDYILYIKLSITMGIVAISSILIALALKEYGTDKKLKEHHYLD